MLNCDWLCFPIKLHPFQETEIVAVKLHFASLPDSCDLNLRKPILFLLWRQGLRRQQELPEARKFW